MDYPLERPIVTGAAPTLAGSIAGRIRSVGYCCAGVIALLRQPASMFHMVMTAAILAASAVLKISIGNWRWVVLAVILVWAAEAVNTAIEYACDAASPGFHPAVKTAKDIAAGAVMLTWLGAAALCGLTWQPYLAHLRLFGG